jgi:hypothetical protein
MSAVNKQYKTPAQIKGERQLRNRNLLVPLSALHNIEVAKRKARAVRLKEEYKRKYLTRGNTRRSANIDNTIYSIAKRTLSFCIKLWLVYLLAIALCTLVGYYLRFIYY